VPDPKRGSVVGWLRDADHDGPIADASLRMFDPVGVFRTDEEGAFAIHDLPPGLRIFQVNSPYYEGIGFLDFAEGVVDTVIVTLEHNGSVPPPRDTTFDRNEGWRPRTTDPSGKHARLVVKVRDDVGLPNPGAYVLLEQGGTMFGGLADSTGRQEFPSVSPGPAELMVRASRHADFRQELELRGGARDSITVQLAPAKSSKRKG
jgi:hypothetical protein